MAVSGGNESGSFRLSYTNLDQTGMLPNTDLRRNTVLFSGGYKLSEKLKADATVNYIRSRSDNRPSISYGTESLMYLWVWYGRADQHRQPCATTGSPAWKDSSSSTTTITTTTIRTSPCTRTPTGQAKDRLLGQHLAHLRFHG